MLFTWKLSYSTNEKPLHFLILQLKPSFNQTIVAVRIKETCMHILQRVALSYNYALHHVHRILYTSRTNSLGAASGMGSFSPFQRASHIHTGTIFSAQRSFLWPQYRRDRVIDVYMHTCTKKSALLRECGQVFIYGMPREYARASFSLSAGCS